MKNRCKQIKHEFLFWLLTMMMIFKCWLFADIANILPADTNIWCQGATWLSWGAISMLIASIVFMTKRWWVTFITMTIFDIWFIANVFYYKANQLFITYNVIRMAYNLRGYTDSLLVFFDWTIWIWPLLTILCILPYAILRINKRQPLAYVATWTLAVVCSLAGALCHYQQKHIENPEITLTADFFNPLSISKADMPVSSQLHLIDGLYISKHSLPANLFRVAGQMIGNKYEEQKLLAKGWTPEEKALLNLAFCHSDTIDAEPQGHLILILVESLNGTQFESKDANGEYVCKNMMSYVHQHPTLYTTNMHQQIKYATSGDGQMILNTGVLPIYDGAACILYGGNAYPNLAHFYEDGKVIAPWPKIWNQDIVTYTYGYKKLLEPDGWYEWTDGEILSLLRQSCEEATKPTCLMAITISTHMPFNRVQPSIVLPDSISEMANSYLQCLHYTDSCIGDFLHWADTAATMVNSTIVIVGDHSIPIDDKNDGKIAFIMRSPAIRESKVIDYCLHMDLYPTILNAIGQNHYYWRGFGVNLINQTYRDWLFMSDETFYFSDRLIRTNYFATIKE